MRSIDIRKTSIANLDADAVFCPVNARFACDGEAYEAIRKSTIHEGVQADSGNGKRCAAGWVGIKPSSGLQIKHIIYLLGSSLAIQDGQAANEYKNIYSAYYAALELAAENGCASVGMPLISAESVDDTETDWDWAAMACGDFFDAHPEVQTDIVFAVTDDKVYRSGHESLFYSDAGRYAVMDAAQRAIYDLNSRLKKIIRDDIAPYTRYHQCAVEFLMAERPDEADIVGVDDDPGGTIYSALFNMYDIACNCKRSFEEIRTEMKNAILQTLNAHEGIVYRLNARGWEKYDNLPSPQCLVRVHGSTDHWYVLNWDEWD